MNLYTFSISDSHISNIKKVTVEQIGAKTLEEVYLKGFYHLYSDGYAKQYAIDVDHNHLYSDGYAKQYARSAEFMKLIGYIKEYNREKIIDELI